MKLKKNKKIKKQTSSNLLINIPNSYPVKSFKLSLSIACLTKLSATACNE